MGLYMSNANIELLRLTGWCKNLPTGMQDRYATRVLRREEIAELEALRLAAVTGNGKCVRLIQGGRKLLASLGYDYPQDAKYISDYGRRLEAAEILLAFYRAGCNVFADSVEDLAPSQVFLTKMAVRRNKRQWGDLFAGERFAGIGCVRREALLCHYVTGAAREAGMYYSRERRTLSGIASVYKYDMALVYAGSSYLEAAGALKQQEARRTERGGRKNDCLSYAEVYRRTLLPLYLLECSDTGAAQLLVLSQENYRGRLSRCLFRGEPPPPEIPEADGLVVAGDRGEAWVCAVAADMEVKRLDRIWERFSKTSYTTLFLACLPGQESALEFLYGGHRNVEIAPISPETLAAAFGRMELYEPEPAAYIDKKGGMLDAANLPLD